MEAYMEGMVQNSFLSQKSARTGVRVVYLLFVVPNTVFAYKKRGETLNHAQNERVT